jgi:anti-sigma regulatory factor (Ser/Thr protein kinase)
VAVGARYLPATAGMEIGGDWYFAEELPDGRLALVVGDVVGHGLQAAGTMGRLSNSARAYALQGYGPASALDALNRLVHTVEDGEMTTLAYVVLDPSTGTARFASAGHPPPLLIDEAGRATYLDGGRSLPLGVEPGSDYTECEVSIAPGGTLLIFTDGLVERRGSAIDEGLARLSEVAARAEGSLERVLDQVVGALLGDTQPADDVVLLGLRLARVPAEDLALRVPAAPVSLAPLRRALEQFLEGAGTGRDEASDIIVACGEAAANAMEHPRGPRTSHIEVDARLEDGVIAVVVRDSGTWKPREGPGRGHGFPVMKALMDDVEVVCDGGGTEVRLRRRLGRSTPDAARPT